MEGKKIIVTGGAGFIGSNIAKEASKSNEVMVIDNMHTGSMDNVKELKDLGVKFFEGASGSISDAHFDPDLIIHVGIYSSTPMYREDHGLVAEVVKDAVRLFDFATERKVPVVFASSSSIYNGYEPPHREDMIPKVTDYYTEARIAVERLAQLYNDMSGLDVTALRLFAVYGPHDERKGTFGNLVTQFMMSIGNGKSPVVYGDGTQKRDFTYVDDVVDAFMLAAKLKGFNIINVGRGESFTINDMIGRLNSHFGTDIKATYVINPLKNYVERTGADTTKAYNIMGFKAKYGLDDGIDRLRDYLVSSGNIRKA
jgi:UDP-glucose 4-epimerase